jgi:cathepsin F
MKILLFFICFAFFGIIRTTSDDFDAINQFSQFISKYNKVYKNADEHEQRFSIFRNNLLLVEQYNRIEKKTIYGVTKFMDLSPEEFRASHLMPKGRIPKPNKGKNVAELGHLSDLPKSFDWRDKGAVTPVYDQAACGSCWAFSATEAIESQWFLAGHPLVSLSPQQIVDCDKGRGDEGCNGGDTPTAYQYVMAAGGMDTMKVYPYTGEDDTCNFQSSGVAAKISSWTYITSNKNETEMMEKLVLKGPLSICVDATTWQFYVGGAITSLCGDDLDHCVLVTGFEDYVDLLGYTIPVWLIRNSWGSDWGESGYLYVERGQNLCGVADEVTIPII